MITFFSNYWLNLEHILDDFWATLDPLGAISLKKGSQKIKTKSKGLSLKPLQCQNHILTRFWMDLDAIMLYFGSFWVDFCFQMFSMCLNNDFEKDIKIWIAITQKTVWISQMTNLISDVVYFLCSSRFIGDGGMRGAFPPPPNGMQSVLDRI